MTAKLCASCGQRPSERIGLKPVTRIVPVPCPDGLPGCLVRHYGEQTTHDLDTCPDPIHDLADRAPEMAEALERLNHAAMDYSADPDSRTAFVELSDAMKQARRALAREKGGE